MEDDREIGQGIVNHENQDSLQSMNDNESVKSNQLDSPQKQPNTENKEPAKKDLKLDEDAYKSKSAGSEEEEGYYMQEIVSPFRQVKLS